MPTVTFRGRTVSCEDGARLRSVLLETGLDPHNGRSSLLNCRGHGTCGTCAVSVSAPDGDDPDVSAVGVRERARLSFPPHSLDSGLRLACQTRVHGDVVVEKRPGFWGHLVEHDGDGDGGEP
jgi:ferredoxin